MLNHIVLMGRLTRDPELRYTGSNVPVASFSIAVDRDFGRGENGEKQTDFINVSAWRQTGEFVSKYFTKGSMIVVSGRLQIRDYTDRDGNRRAGFRSATGPTRKATSAVPPKLSRTTSISAKASAGTTEPRGRSTRPVRSTHPAPPPTRALTARKRRPDRSRRSTMTTASCRFDTHERSF